MTEEKPSELEDIKKKAEEYLNNWKRERADFINYKKDEVERAGLLVQYAKEDMFLNLLPILDSIYLMKTHLEQQEQQTNKLEFVSLSEGLHQIEKQIAEFLKKEGIEEIVTQGKEFDPATMEAIGESADGKLEEIQKGYTMNGKVIRPAKVKISK